MDMVFVYSHDVNVKIRIVCYGLKYCLDVIIKLFIQYPSSVFDAENKMVLQIVFVSVFMIIILFYATNIHDFFCGLQNI